MIEVVFSSHCVLVNIDILPAGIEGIRYESIFIWFFCVYCFGLEDSKLLLPVIITWFSWFPLLFTI